MINWRSFLFPYEQAVEELKIKFKSLRNEYRKKSIVSPIEFITGRVKAVPSIIDKAQKMGYSESEIGEKMEDIAGIRIMCQFEDDIYKVVELINRRDGIDMHVIQEKNYIKYKKDSGYRSYHMIIKYPVVTTEGTTELLAEIQIRTLSMNFWATIEHSLKYKYKENIPEKVAEKLLKTAEAAYMLDKEMLEIRDEVIAAQELFMVKDNLMGRIMYYINMLDSMQKKDLALLYRIKLEKATEEADEIKRDIVLSNLGTELMELLEDNN
ncbi:MAG: GTP pyrophosphokinase family protein [Peptostreptococcales bacterium]